MGYKDLLLDPFGEADKRPQKKKVRVVLGKKRYTAKEVEAILNDLPYENMEVKTRWETR